MSSESTSLRDRLTGRIEQNSQRKAMIRRFRQNRLGMVGLGLSIIYILIAVIGPLLITSDPTSINPTVRFQNPSLEHLF